MSLNLTAAGLAVFRDAVGLSCIRSIMLDPQNPSGFLNYNRLVNVNSTVTNTGDVGRPLKLNWQSVRLT
jgi:hypothetical protein